MKHLLLPVSFCLFVFSSIGWITDVHAQIEQPGPLNELVPYQSDSILLQPVVSSEFENKVFMECDWRTLMLMIRDLEERIAGALEIDTVYDDYASIQIPLPQVYRDYDCYVLRDSIWSLQIQLDEALISTPTVVTELVENIAQHVASIKAQIIDDGGAALRNWGVMYGKYEWWDADSRFFNLDSIGANTFTDPLLTNSLAPVFTFINNAGSPPFLTAPMPLSMDTLALDSTWNFTTELTGLERYTHYIALPIASNDSVQMEFFDNTTFGLLRDEEELNWWPLGWYGVGDSLDFWTLPDLANGFSLDTANVSQTAARLIFSVNDLGGQGPDNAGFYYDNVDFTAVSFAGDSLASDSSSGSYHTAELTGLTRYTDYFFRGFIDNLAGRGVSETSMAFKTLPDIPTFNAISYDYASDSLRATIDDDGGVTPTTQFFKYSADQTFASSSNVASSLVASEVSAELLESALNSGTEYFVIAGATNDAGTGYSDTISFVTRVAVSTDSLNQWSTSSLHAFGSYTVVDNAASPTSTGLRYGFNSQLSNAQDTLVIAGSDHAYTSQLSGFNPGTAIWVAAFATNEAGERVGSTLSSGTKSTITTVPPSQNGVDSLSLGVQVTFTTLPPTTVNIYVDDDASLGNPVSLQPSVGAMTASSHPDSIQSVDLYASLTNPSNFTFAAGTKYYFYGETIRTGIGSQLSADTAVTATTVGVTTVSLTLDPTDNAKLIATGSLDYHDAQPDSSGFVFSPNANMSSSNDTIVIPNADSTFTLSISGLSPGSVQYVKAFSWNLGGVSYGSALTGATAVGVTTNAPSAASTQKMTLSGSAIYATAPADTVGFIWGEEATLTFANDTMRPVAPSFSAEIDVLPGSDYYYAAYAHNQSGWSFGDTIQAFSLVDVRSEPVSNPTDTTAYLNASFVYHTELGKPDSVGFSWYRTDLENAPVYDTTLAFSAVAADSTLSLNLPFVYSKNYGYKAFAINGAGKQFGEELYFCAGACPETFDYQGFSYGLVRIGCDCYFTENLRTRTYANGDSILQYNFTDSATHALFYENPSESQGLEIGSMLALEESDRAESGDFYNEKIIRYDVSSNLRKVCPPGWRVLDAEKLTLITSMLPSSMVPDLNGNNDIGYIEIANALGQAVKADSIGSPVWDGSDYFGFDFKPVGIFTGDSITNVGSKAGLWAIQKYPEFTQIMSFELSDQKSDCEDGSCSLYNLFESSAFVVQTVLTNRYHSIRCMSQEGKTAPEVFGINATNHTANSATINGYIGHNGWRTTSVEVDVLESGFIYSLNEDLSDSIWTIVPVPTNDSLSLDLINLVENERYYYQCYAINENDTAYSDIRYFEARVPSIPTVVTNPVSDVYVNNFSKVQHTHSLTVTDKGNSEILSAGWRWSTTPDFTSAVDDSTQWAGFHEGVEDLVLNITETFTNQFGSPWNYIREDDYKPGQTIYYVAYATNSIGTGWGDTLMFHIPKAIRDDRVISNDHGADIHGQVFFQDTPPDTLGLMWSTDGTLWPSKFLEITWNTTYTQVYDSLCQSFFHFADSTSYPTGVIFSTQAQRDSACATGWEYDPMVTDGYITNVAQNVAFLYLQNYYGGEFWFEGGSEGQMYSPVFTLNEHAVDRRDYMKNPMDTLYVQMNPDGSFVAELVLPDSVEIGTRVYYQFFTKDTIGDSYGSTSYFSTGLCFPREYQGHTYQTQRFSDQCVFTENLRSELNNEGDTIAYVDLTVDSTTTTINSAQQQAYGELNQAATPAQSFPDSTHLALYGRVYNNWALYPDAKLCPVGTHVLNRGELERIVGDVDRMNRMSPEEHDPLSLNYYATVDARVMWNMASWWTNQNWLSHLSSVPGYVAGQNTNGFNLGGRGFFFNIGGGSWTSQYESQLWGGPMERANGSFTLAQGIKTNGSATTNDGNIIELTYQNVGPQIIWESVFSTNASDQNRMMPVRCVMDDDGPMVRSESATHLTDSSMRLNASFQFEGYRALSSTGFKWGYQADLSDASDVAGDTLGGPFSSELTGLSSGVTIHYSAYAMDSLGRISYGDTLSQYLMSCENVEIDGHLYQTAMIGNQCWFTEDLQTSTYRDGSAITEVNYNCGDTGTEPCWGYLPVGGSGSPQSYTAFVSYNGKKFYTYNAALGTLHGGICPIGWHLPTSYDWNQLATGFTAGFGESTWTPATFQGQGTGYASYDEIEEQEPFDPVTFTGGYTIYKTAFSMVELDHAAYWTGTNNNAVKWIETDNAYTESVTDAYFGLQIRCIRDADTIPIVTTELDYSGMTDSTAMFSASLEFNWVPMTSTGFIWGYSPDLSDASSITADTLAGNFQAELTGRSRLDTLYFSAFATNFLGTTYGDTLSVVVRYHGCGPATTFDYDGYSYNVFSRGDQCWFAENLRNDHYSDGTVIPGELDNSAWVSDTDGAQGFLSNDSTYLNTNGRLYNWHAVNNTHGLCPSGWHVTSDEEFTELTNQYGGQYTAGNALKASPSDFPAWDGTNTSGFSAMLTSYRQTNGTYQPAGNGYYWTSTSANSTQAWYRMFYNVTNSVYRGQNSVLYGYAARCVSDGALCHDPLATNYQLSGECDY